MLVNNLTSGNHPYNFSGICMALVAQWLMEIKFSNGETPEELGRYLLQGWLGSNGYGGLASSQGIYGTTTREPTITRRWYGATSGMVADIV